MLKEIEVRKEGVGIVRVTTDSPEDQEPKMSEIAFGEYQAPTGELYVLTRKKAYGILKMATTVEQAMLIVNDTAPEGPEWA